MRWCFRFFSFLRYFLTCLSVRDEGEMGRWLHGEEMFADVQASGALSMQPVFSHPCSHTAAAPVQTVAVLLYRGFDSFFGYYQVCTEPLLPTLLQA